MITSMKVIKLTINALFTGLVLVIIPATALAATATQNQINQGINDAAGSNQTTSPETTLNSTVTHVVSVLTVVVGVIAVIMIIIAGLRYTASAGNPEAAKEAKNTILYAVIGLVIVAMAQIIVHFVLNRTT